MTLHRRPVSLDWFTNRCHGFGATGATESAFREGAPQCGMLHLATHGFFATPQDYFKQGTELLAQSGPLTTGDSSGLDTIQRGNLFGNRREDVRGFSPGLLSGLVFAGANNPPEISGNIEEIQQIPDDGIMTSDEIAFLPLSGVRLVVLSACETGLGEVAGGEGLLGIQRAFQVSGAHSTVATLWSVDDKATMAIMQVFYMNYLDKEMSALDALREAQLWALKNPDAVVRGDARRRLKSEQRTSPFYWAAFTLSGDWR